MAIVVPLPPEEVKLAGEVARHAELQNIRLRECSIKIGDISPKPKKDGTTTPLRLKLRSKTLRQKVERHVLIADVRFQTSISTSEKKNAPSVAHWSIVLRVEYELESSYTPSQKALKAFAGINALFNCWPYWREFCGNIIYRANLPPLILPLLHIVPELKKRKRR